MDFTILENKMLKPFATLISCRDTVNSECSRGLSLQDCVQECRENPFCSCGYWLQPKEKGQLSYCAPLNSILLKNMNLHWNTYDKDTDPSSSLWSKTAVFFRPNVYPPVPPDNTLLMQRDICAIYYTHQDNKYFLQEDYSWKLDAEESAAMIVFIDKFPQFYELANNIQDQSTFVLKIFGKPLVIAVEDNKLVSIPYLSIDPTKNRPDTYLYIQHEYIPPEIDYPVLTFDSVFQILVDSQNKFLGIEKVATKGQKDIVLTALPWDKKDSSFTGYFKVIRKSLQPNIYKVAEILPARLTFLENSIIYPSPSHTYILIVLILSLIMLVIMFILFLKKDPTQQSQTQTQKQKQIRAQNIFKNFF